jgi:hypothetical protein
MGFIYLFVAGLKVKGAIAASVVNLVNVNRFRIMTKARSKQFHLSLEIPRFIVHIPIVAELLCVTFCPWVGVVW